VKSGWLYVVATPIGNLEDITFRAVRVLKEVDLIAAEDTRSARVLLSHYDIAKPCVSLYRENEARRSEEIRRRLGEGLSVALISEAGTPGISDPGQRLINACIQDAISVDVIPGPNAAVTALVLSGLPTDRFDFIGFLPRKGGRRNKALKDLKGREGTLIIYESPRRVGETLAQLAHQLGDRPAVVARELTKRFQEVVRGSLSELAQKYADQDPRGEVTLVVGGDDAPKTVSEEQLNFEIQRRLDQGESPRQIADALTPQGRRRVYQAALALRDKAPGADP